jgi:hypothetical protein
MVQSFSQAMIVAFIRLTQRPVHCFGGFELHRLSIARSETGD